MKSRYRWSLLLVALILPFTGATKFDTNAVEDIKEIAKRANR